MGYHASVPSLSRRTLLAAGTAALALPRPTWAADVKPKVTVISQWSAGSDGAAITALGKEFEKEGGIWEHNPVPGFTTEMMNKLRAQIIAGDPPAASQLKGPEIAAWSKIAPVVDLDALVKQAGYEAVVPAELARLSKPEGHWIALPIQAYRINTLFISKKAADASALTKLPATWAEFNDVAGKMKAAGITPVANGGITWDDGMKWEIALCGISPAAYRKAVMELDDEALKGPEVLAAFRQTRKLADWSDPGVAGQHYSVFIPRYMKGDIGMLLMGGWAQGVFKHAGFQFSDYMIGPAPQDDGKIAFDLNSDEFIFWQKKQPEFQAGQKLLAKIVMRKDLRADVLHDHRLDPGAHRHRPLGARLQRWPARGGARDGDGDGRQPGGAEPGPQHGAAEPDRRGDDRRADRVRPQQPDKPGTGPEAARRGGGQRRAERCALSAARPRRLAAPSGRILPHAGDLAAAADSVRLRAGVQRLDRLGVVHPIDPAAGLSLGRAAQLHRDAWQPRTGRSPTSTCSSTAFCFVVLTMAVGLLLAVLIDQRVRGENVLPHDLPVSDGGVLRGDRHGVGLAAQSAASASRSSCTISAGPASGSTGWWTATGRSTCIVIAGVWQASGFAMALFLAGLRSVDSELLKAAADRRRRPVAHLSPRGVPDDRADLRRRAGDAAAVRDQDLRSGAWR